MTDLAKPEHLPLSSPLHEMPFDDAEMVLIARIHGICASVISQLSAIYVAIDRRSLAEFLAFEGHTLGRQVGVLRGSVDQCSTDAHKASLTEALDALAPCIERRNTLTHGAWCWLHSQPHSWRRGAFNRPKQTFLGVEDLPQLHEDLSAAALAIDRAMRLFHPVGGELGEARNLPLIFASAPPDQPGGPPALPPRTYTR